MGKKLEAKEIARMTAGVSGMDAGITAYRIMELKRDGKTVYSFSALKGTQETAMEIICDRDDVYAKAGEHEAINLRTEHVNIGPARTKVLQALYEECLVPVLLRGKDTILKAFSEHTDDLSLLEKQFSSLETYSSTNGRSQNDRDDEPGIFDPIIDGLFFLGIASIAVGVIGGLIGLLTVGWTGIGLPVIGMFAAGFILAGLLMVGLSYLLDHVLGDIKLSDFGKSLGLGIDSFLEGETARGKDVSWINNLSDFIRYILSEGNTDQSYGNPFPGGSGTEEEPGGCTILTLLGKAA